MREDAVESVENLYRGTGRVDEVKVLEFDSSLNFVQLDTFGRGGIDDGDSVDGGKDFGSSSSSTSE